MVTNHTKEEFLKLVIGIIEIQRRQQGKWGPCFCCGYTSEDFDNLRALLEGYFGNNTYVTHWDELSEEAARVLEINLLEAGALSGKITFQYDDTKKELSYAIERKWSRVIIQ